MNHEDARTVALAMLAALGKGWVMGLADNHGFTPRVTNGPCVVLFSENSRTYSAFIRQGSSSHTGNGPDPVRALELAAGGMEASYRRVTADRDAIMAITHLALGLVPQEVKP